MPVSMDTSVDPTATSWFPRVYNFHSRILGNVFVNWSTYPNIFSCYGLLISVAFHFCRMIGVTQCQSGHCEEDNNLLLLLAMEPYSPVVQRIV
jgi:hypothetical protein